MIHRHIRIVLPAIAAAMSCWAILPVTATAQPPASVTVATKLAYNVTTLGITGTATCAGGGAAGVDVANGSLEQMFQGGLGGPIAIRLNEAVMVSCDGAPHGWSGNLIAPGRVLPASSGGTVTVNLRQGSNVIATTGPQPVYIAS